MEERRGTRIGLAFALHLLLACALSASCSPQDGTVAPPDLRWVNAGRPGVPNIREFSTPWSEGCGSGCTNAYLEFIAGHTDDARPVDEEELDAELRAVMLAEPPEKLGLAPAEMRAELIRRLNIGFLLDGLEERGLGVSVLSERRRPGFVQRKLLFWDPEVGSFEGSLLLPERPGARPGIIALHGHKDSEEDFIDEFLGARLAAAGFVVLLPRLRALDCSANESSIALDLLRSGFTLMGLHVYEVLLMQKYLLQLPQVDPDGVGIIGHSGGHSIASLVVWIADGFRAQVGDHRTDFRDVCRHTGTHCETIPAIFPLSADINDEDTPPIPFHGSPYRFRNLEEELVAFFQVKLGG